MEEQDLCNWPFNHVVLSYDSISSSHKSHQFITIQLKENPSCEYLILTEEQSLTLTKHALETSRVLTISPVWRFHMIMLGDPVALPVLEQVAPRFPQTLTQLMACLAYDIERYPSDSRVEIKVNLLTSMVNLSSQSGNDQTLSSLSKHPDMMTSGEASKSETGTKPS